jgi:DNA-binding transcriptional LysR family regulator
MDVDTTALRWFQLVADGATVTEVSELEGLSQPGLSRALGRLELEVGSSLLVRSGRVLRMTRAGAAFKPYVDRALHELDDGLAAVSAMASPDTGHVSLAYQRSLGSWLVPRLIADFQGAYPLVRFTVEPISDDDRPARAGTSTDFQITTSVPHAAEAQWRPLLVEPLALVVPSGHRLAGADDVELRVVADEPFVLVRAPSSLRRTCDELCRAAGFEPTVVLEGDDLQTVEGFVSVALGVSIVPAGDHPLSAAARSDPLAPRWIPLRDKGASRAIGISWSSGRKLLPAAQNFLESAATTSRRPRPASQASTAG